MIYLLILIALLLTLILVVLINIKEILLNLWNHIKPKDYTTVSQSFEIKHCNDIPCSEKACDPIEIEANSIIAEEKVVNPKAEHTKEQLEILERLAGQSIKESDIKIYFSKSTNSLVYRYKDSCVKKEYHGRLFLNYTLMKHNRVFKILYKEDIEEFNKTCVKQQEEKEQNNKRRFYTNEEYRTKVEDFMNLKRSTMIPDETLFKKIGISREALHKYITKEELTELNNLRQKCRATGMDKLRKKGSK